MIPRFKPVLDIRELKACFSPAKKNDVERFEQTFAELMDQRHALAFPYGRTGLLLLLETLGLKNKEIICPAYTCVVVPHAIVFSGNTPVFVDCEPDGFNMDLEQAEAKITNRTGAIIATSIFGYPINLDRLDKIRFRYPHIYIIQDCAHSFDAKWNGRPVHRDGIATLFGLNISKMLTSIFGGIISTDDDDVYQKLRIMRDQRLKRPDWRKSIRRLLYLLSVYPTFWGPIYGLINRMERSGLLNYFVQYYDESKIDMPMDYMEGMCGIEARVGTANIDRYETIINKRRAAAKYYFEHLTNKPDFRLPPEVEGATYSHFVVQVSDRDAWQQWALKYNIQLGCLIEYNIPEMDAYGGYESASYPFAAEYARTTINLPLWGGGKIAEKVVKVIQRRAFV
jgi:perosamine synthetase